MSQVYHFLKFSVNLELTIVVKNKKGEIYYIGKKPGLAYDSILCLDESHVILRADDDPYFPEIEFLMVSDTSPRIISNNGPIADELMRCFERVKKTYLLTHAHI